MMLLGGRVLDRTAAVEAWFLRHFVAGVPTRTWLAGRAVVGALDASGYAALVAIDRDVRAVYVAGTIDRATVTTGRVVPFSQRLAQSGYFLRIHDGGLIAEERTGSVEAHDAIGNALHAIVTASHLARDLGAIPTLLEG
jgi:hypothetical protein